MAKVLLVNPSLAYSTWSADLLKPSPDSVFIRLGLAYLAGALKSRGHEVHLADLRTLSGWREYTELVRRISPEFVGISIHSVEFSIAVEAARIVKQVLPSAKVVAGGVHSTMFPKECIDTGVFDYVLQGEGEITFPAFIENPSKFPKTFWGETPDLNMVPFPDREIWPDFKTRIYSEPFGISKYRFPLPMVEMINIRGCPFNCTFCVGPGEKQLYTKVTNDGKRIPNIRGRSVQNVIAEIEMLINKYGIKSVMFHDDQFIVSPQWVDEFIGELHRRGIVRYGLKWVTSSRADIICRNKDLIGMMADAGLELLIIGFESFSPRILKWFNKGVTVEQNFLAAEICHKHGVKIWANYILGIRTDTGWHKEDDMLTVAGVLKADPVHYSPAFYTPVPGSKLFDFYKSNDLIESTCSSIEDLSNRGKFASKLKGVDYSFLESIMVDDSIFFANLDIKELMKDYSPEMNDMDDSEYIKAKSIDAAAGIIRVMDKKAEGVKSNINKLQSAVSQAHNKIETSKKIINRMLSSVVDVSPIITDKTSGNVIDSKISIVIPVLNGGRQLADLFGKIRSQKRVTNVEIVVIDSGSTDNTVQISHEFGAKVIEIPKEEFNHGTTRQLGVDNATGEVIVLTVHDAYPASDYWLYKMVKCLKDNPELSVVSVRQMVNINADMYSKWTNDATYKAYGLQKDIKYSLKDPGSFDYLPDDVRRIVSFVDDVCACYRADVVKKFRFNRLTNAEDIDIGARMAKAGHCLGFLYTNGVYHWHSDGPDYYLKRHFNGVKSFVNILGNEIPNFELFYIKDFEDICLKSAVLYHTVKLGFEEWGIDGQLTSKDFQSFINIIEDTIQRFSEKYKKNLGSGKEQVFEELLDALNCKLSDEDMDSNLFRYNHLVMEFSMQLKDLIKYILENFDSLKVSRSDFYDGVLKIVASRIGDVIGQWVMQLKKDGRDEEANHIEMMLSKGVCYR